MSYLRFVRNSSTSKKDKDYKRFLNHFIAKISLFSYKQEDRTKNSKNNFNSGSRVLRFRG